MTDRFEEVPPPQPTPTNTVQEENVQKCHAWKELELFILENTFKTL